MIRWISISMGSLASMTLLLLALWGWMEAPRLVKGFELSNPLFTIWGVRCGAIAAGLAAQAILLTFVLGQVYHRTERGDLARALAMGLCTLAFAGGVAFTLAGR